MTNIVITNKTLATKLQDAEAQIEVWEKLRKDIREELLENLKKQGVKGIKLDNGTWYVRAERTTLKVKNEASALKWAIENNAMKIDTNTAWKILRREMKLPKFFMKSTTEFLTIKRPKDNSDVD